MLYTCTVINTGQQESALSAIKGTHFFLHSYDDVYAFRVDGKTWNNIPNNISNYLPNVKTFQIIKCELNTVSRENFKGFRFLQDLNFFRNKLKNINDDTFDYVKNLKGLYLNSNLLESISSQTFASLSMLKVLVLNNNKLKEIPKHAFEKNLNLELLDLSENQLNFIPCTTFNSLKMLKTLDMSRNICSDFKMTKTMQEDNTNFERAIIKCDDVCKDLEESKFNAKIQVDLAFQKITSLEKSIQDLRDQVNMSENKSTLLTQKYSSLDYSNQLLRQEAEHVTQNLYDCTETLRNSSIRLENIETVYKNQTIQHNQKKGASILFRLVFGVDIF